MTQRDRIIEAEVSTWNEDAQFEFWAIVAEGNTLAFAQMCVCRQAPTMGLASDRQFNSSYRRRMNTMDQRNRAKVLEIARRAGIATDGKYYVSGLGRYDDPLAWCSTSDDVKAAVKAKNMTAHGPGIHHNGTPADPPPPKPLADDIVQRFEKQHRLSDPKLNEQCRKSKKARAELRERVIASHTRKRS